MKHHADKIGSFILSGHDCLLRINQSWAAALWWNDNDSNSGGIGAAPSGSSATHTRRSGPGEEKKINCWLCIQVHRTAFSCSDVIRLSKVHTQRKRRHWAINRNELHSFRCTFNAPTSHSHSRRTFQSGTLLDVGTMYKVDSNSMWRLLLKSWSIVLKTLIISSVCFSRDGKIEGIQLARQTVESYWDWSTSTLCMHNRAWAMSVQHCSWLVIVCSREEWGRKRNRIKTNQTEKRHREE